MARQTAPRVDTSDQRPTGTLVVYDRKGVEIHRQEGFQAGRDLMPAGISLTAGASMVVSPSGEVLTRWDPWRVLRDGVTDVTSE